MSSHREWILVRHGDTEWTEKRKLHGGRFDSPLSPRGRRQAELTGSALSKEHIKYIYSSPQGRAMQTSEIIGDLIGIDKIQPIEGFREQRYGLLEGGPILSFGAHGSSAKVLKPITTLIRNATGESDRRFLQRVAEGVREVRSINTADQILIVSHWGALSALMVSLYNEDAEYWIEDVKWSPCGITKIQQVDGQWEIVSQDDTGHLTELEGEE